MQTHAFKKKPSFSIIIPTLNNEHDIPLFFDSFHKQSYDKNKIELIAADGGSTDNTVSLLQKKGVKVLNNKYKLAEPGIHLGMEEAHGDIIMVLALDNFFHDINALKTIAQVYENNDVFGAVLKHDNESTYSLFTKYHNIFTDPFNHFINGDASNTRTFHRVYKTIYKSSVYDVYDFLSSSSVPMMSFSQGFSVRGTYRRNKKDMYDDVTPVIDIIRSGKKIAYIHSVSVYHNTNKDYKQFIRKQRWATENALSSKNYGIAHRASQLSLAQKIKMYIWPAYSLSIIFPLIVGVFGFFRDKQLLWLFHPVECLLCGYANAIQVVEHIHSKLFNSKTITRR